MHLATANNLFIAGSLIGFSVGLAITVLLVIFTVRALRIPGATRANLQCAICALIWNAGGLGHSIVSALSPSKENPMEMFALAVQFTGAAVWPVPMLLAWSPFALQRWQKAGMRALTIMALIIACVVVVALWANAIFHVGRGHEIALKEFTSFNASLVMIPAAILVLRGGVHSRTTRIASIVILLGVLATTLGVIVLEGFGCTGNLAAALALMSEQSTLLIVLGAFFLFAHFRFADVFIRYSVSILLAGGFAVMLTFGIRSSLLWHLSLRSQFTGAISAYVASALTATVLVVFVHLDRSSEAFVNRWIFRAPDYKLAARRLGEFLSRLHADSEIGAAVEDAVRSILEVEDARLLTLDELSTSGASIDMTDAEPLETSPSNPLGAAIRMPHLELLVPVLVGGQSRAALAVSPGPARRGLVSREVDFLKALAVHVGSRFEALRLERESVEQRSREALLRQQVTEAELRALRAQINPHFLFNSLNTIANLIVTNPGSAETMTLRLARTFRYVLAHSSRSLTSIHEEIEFLRTYLQIEAARFGERLKVEFDVSPDAEAEHIPSLILQPLVENALKHGLAPKLGPGLLSISVRTQGDCVCLRIEDDGVGLDWAGLPGKKPDLASWITEDGARSPAGVGLRNVAQRLATLYRDRARMDLELRLTGGTRVTLLVPRSNGVATC